MKSTTDLWIVAFLLLKGYKIEDYELIAPKRGRYYFNISDEDWKVKKLEYSTSIVNDVRKKIEEIKSLVA